jgi:hypothetical protein
MNERIEKLWTKVCQSEMPELDETCMTLQRRTKFAELIVKECAHIAWLYDDPKLYWHGAVIAKSIKHRFGVE